jgi:hypothetical protein
MKIDPKSYTSNLPESLIIPIAAKNIEAIKEYIGDTVKIVSNKKLTTSAILVKPYYVPVISDSNVPLWSDNKSLEYFKKLHPEYQVWVHVDSSTYRRDYIKLLGCELNSQIILDHIHNREVIRLQNYSHPLLRLCSIDKNVNTNAGNMKGGEGLQKDFVKNLATYSKEIQDSFYEAISCDIIYADPMDITKMLNVVTGTHVLNGVRDMQKLFYPI